MIERDRFRRPLRIAGALAVVCFAATWAASGAGAAKARRIDLADIDRLVGVSDPQISADGTSIVVVVSRANVDKNRFDSELVLVDARTGARRVLTYERKGVGHPRWSPEGSRLAFLALSGSGKEEHRQVFVLEMRGGEAGKITSSPTGVRHFSWRPDGKAIAFAAADEAPNKKAIEKGDDAFEVGNDDVFVGAAPMPVHIWLVPAEGGEARRLTSGTWSLPVSLPPSPPASPLSWSPDGKLIAFAKQATPHSGDADQVSVDLLEVATGTIRALTGKNLFETFPSFSPDGSKVAYWYARDGDPNNVNDIHVAPATGGSGTNVTRPIDRCLYRGIWMPDGKSLLVGGNDGTRVSLWLAPLEGAARRLDLGAANPSWSFFVDVNVGRDGAVAFTGKEPDHPTELYYMPSASSPARRLTDFNDEIAALDLGSVERFEWDGPDGFREDGLVFFPPGYTPGRKLPLVLAIHGGPQAASTLGFSALPRLMAARGWLVFQPNYRGSDNRGNVYQRAIFNDAGDGPGRDVMAGVEALKKRGLVDPARVAVTGWSYGGYMTSWLIGHYGGWKAAVAGAAVTDLEDQYNLCDFNVNMRYSFPGFKPPSAPGAAKAYREQSPISYAASMKTPTLILTDTGDARVAPTQSFRLYHALKDQGVPVKFVAYPVGGHFPADPVRARDVYRRWLEWLEGYLK